MQQTLVGRHARRILAASLVTASLACGGGSSPTAPTATTPTPSPTPTPPTPVIDTRQPASSTVNNAQTSQRTGAANSSTQVFDDFSASSVTTIVRVSWQGIYCVQTVNAPAPAPTATSFLVAIHPDRNDSPDLGLTLSSGTYQIGQVAQTLGTTSTTGRCGTAQPTSIPRYSYEVTLNTPFTAAAGVKYWVSVQANTPDFTVFWGWLNGTANNNRSLQLTPAGATNVFDTDRAFALLP
jgi:hypothetical protein